MVLAAPAERVAIPDPRRPFFWLVLFALLLATQINPWWRPVEDGVSYLSIARNLAAGRLLRFGSPHLRYAIGYPIVIAPAFWFGDHPFLLISIIHWLLAIFFMLGIYAWARQYVAPAVAVLLTGLSLLNAGYWHFENLTLSETSFVGLFCWGAWALDQLATARTRRATLFYLLISTLLVTAAGITRQVGVFLLVGFALRLLIDVCKHCAPWGRAIALLAAVSIVPVTAVAGLIEYDRIEAAHVQRLDQSYSSEFREPDASLPEQIWLGMHREITNLGELMVPGMFKFYSRHWYEPRLITKVDPNLIIYLPAAAFIICGWWWFVRASRDVWALTAPFYVALFVVWPYDPQTRYLMPLAPIWFIAVWWALMRCGWGKQWVLVALLVAHFIFAEGYYLSDLKQAIAENRHWPANRELVSHITHDRESVAISAKILPDQRLMLQYLLDRRITTASPADTSFTWWIMGRAQNPPPGYSAAWQNNDMTLYTSRNSPKN